jgi:hypothetical protein
MRKIAMLVAVAFQAGAAAAAPQIKTPTCEALTAWGASVNPADVYTVAPRLSLPKAFQDAQLVPLFGAPALDWSQEDVQAASQGFTACYQEAGKRRDRVAAGALVNGNKAVLGYLPRTNGALLKAKTDAEAIDREIAALPDSAELDRSLEALLKGNPEGPDLNPIRNLPREVVQPLWRLAGVVPLLAHAERESLYKRLGERRQGIQASQAAEADKAIAAAPADAAGALALMELRGRIAGFSDPVAKASLDQKAEEKLRRTREGLRQAKPPAWAPPDCLDLYRWSGAPNATAAVGMANRGVIAAFMDERAAPAFGVSVGDWTDQDVAAFRALRDLCRNQAQATVAGGAGASELAQLANRGRWIESADQSLVDARAAILDYRKAQSALTAATAKIDALPDAAASLAALNQLSAEPALAAVTQDDRVRFANVVNAKRAAIGARAAEAAMKGLADFKATTLADLGKLLSYGQQASASIPDARGQQAFGAAFARTMDEAAAHLLPEFQAKLAALPASLEGIGAAQGAVEELTGLDGGGRMAALKPYREAAQARRQAIAEALREEACGGLLSSLGVGGDAKQELWDGTKGMPLGAFICRLAEAGAAVNDYSGAGLFSSTYTLTVTPAARTMLTFSLRKGEVLAGRPMLVGYQMKDATQERPISVEEWEQFAALAKLGGILSMEGCRRFENTPPEKVGAPDKVFWLSCLFEAGGLGRMGR